MAVLSATAVGDGPGWNRLCRLGSMQAATSGLSFFETYVMFRLDSQGVGVSKVQGPVAAAGACKAGGGHREGC